MKSLTNMSSGICQNQYPAIENGMDVGKKQKNKQTNNKNNSPGYSTSMV